MKKLFLLVSLMVSPYLYAQGWTEPSTIDSIFRDASRILIKLESGPVDPNIATCNDNDLIYVQTGNGYESLLNLKLQNVSVSFYIDGCAPEFLNLPYPEAKASVVK